MRSSEGFESFGGAEETCPGEGIGDAEFRRQDFERFDVAGIAIACDDQADVGALFAEGGEGVEEEFDAFFEVDAREKKNGLMGVWYFEAAAEGGAVGHVLESAHVETERQDDGRGLDAEAPDFEVFLLTGEVHGGGAVEKGFFEEVEPDFFEEGLAVFHAPSVEDAEGANDEWYVTHDGGAIGDQGG